MRMRRIVWGVAAAMLLLGISSLAILQAERLLTEEQAIKDMLPGVDRVEKVAKVLTDAEVGRIKARIGGMVMHQEGSKAKEMAENREYTFYFGIKDNKKVGVAVFDSQPGKWGPVDFILALDPATGKLTNMAVTAYTEKRGRPIALKSFLSQFFGKTSKDPIEVNKDIKSISGATISAKCAAFQVKKVVVMYEELFFNRPLIDRLKDSQYYDVRSQALNEFKGLNKTEQNELLSYLITDLGRKEITECEKRAIISTLNAAVNPEIVAKLEAFKYPANTVINTNLEETLTKATELAGLKLSWANDSLKSAASQIAITEKIKPQDSDNFWVLLEFVTSRYGCTKHRNLKDDKFPAYAFSLAGDTVSIIDIEIGQKQWQEWWNSYNKKNKEEKKEGVK